MATLPQLLEEDVRRLDATLQEFNAQTDAIVAMVIDIGGFLITHSGEAGEIDLTTLGALASGAFMASQSIAGLVGEKDFSHTSLQGAQFSLYTTSIDTQCLLLVVYPSKIGLGVVKYYSGNTVTRLAQHLAIARERDPAGGLDLSEMNLANPEEIFRKKAG
jgi:predicted regulator of Ras-like GTPase activity (Roadblock/LC7/MglB family)